MSPQTTRSVPHEASAESAAPATEAPGAERATRKRRIRHLMQLVPAWAVSSLVHLAAFAALLLIPYRVQQHVRAVVVDTRLQDQAPPVDFARLLEEDYDPDTDFFDSKAGADVAVDGSAGPEPPKAQQLELPPAVGVVKLDSVGREVGLPPRERLDVGLSVKGEELVVVAGQGEAMDQITREILTRLRKKPVLVVWMFDESGSMFDERQDIKQRFGKVYEELAAHPETGNRALLSAVVGFGKEVHFITDRPTDDVELLKKHMDEVPIDPSGEEWPCKHLIAVAKRFEAFGRRGGRDVMVVLVTDESGQRSPDGLTPLDGMFVEEAISALQNARMALYVIGRQSAFGFPFVTIRFEHPRTKQHFWIRITRGPETPGVECLQINGLTHARLPVASGFGPWELVRLTRETGGIYFLTPSDEAGPQRDYQYDPFVMKNYLPDYGPRVKYLEDRRRKPLRAALFEVIRATAGLRVRLTFPVEPVAFRQVALQAAQAARTNRVRLREAYALLQKAAEHYGAERSLRWRAAFDLATAQLFAYQVRLYQYEQMLRRLAQQPPAPEAKPQPGERIYWEVRICPTETQSWVDAGELDPVLADCRKLYQVVLDKHPGTPWARMANMELRQGFSVRLVFVHYRPTAPPPGVKPVPPPEL